METITIENNFIKVQLSSSQIKDIENIIENKTDKNVSINIDLFKNVDTTSKDYNLESYYSLFISFNKSGVTTGVLGFDGNELGSEYFQFDSFNEIYSFDSYKGIFTIQTLI